MDTPTDLETAFAAAVEKVKNQLEQELEPRVIKLTEERLQAVLKKFQQVIDSCKLDALITASPEEKDRTGKKWTREEHVKFVSTCKEVAAEVGWYKGTAPHEDRHWGRYGTCMKQLQKVFVDSSGRPTRPEDGLWAQLLQLHERRWKYSGYPCTATTKQLFQVMHEQGCLSKTELDRRLKRIEVEKAKTPQEV